jgi:hypothetical protein
MAAAAPLERGMKMTLPLLAAACLLAPSLAAARVYAVVVTGLGGQDDYAGQFEQQAAAIAKASGGLGDDANVKLLGSSDATRVNVQAALKAVGQAAAPDDRLLLYLIGHGSYDGEEYKFNVTGPDFTGRELAGWLDALPMGQQLVVVTGSSSGALQDPLKKSTRIVITGTRSGAERNVTRFGSEFAQALDDAAADADKNGTVSAQEAFDFAQRNVKSYFEKDARLASEHAQLSGERATAEVVARLAGSSATGTSAAPTPPVVDSPERRRLTVALETLRAKKGELVADDYNAKLEALLLELATLDAAAPAESPAVLPATAPR